MFGKRNDNESKANAEASADNSGEKKKFYKKKWFWVVIAVLLIFSLFSGNNNDNGSTNSESNASTEEQNLPTEENRGEAILLIAGETGQYGTIEKLEQDGEVLKEYIAYRVPAGTYIVTNKGSNMTQVTIYKDGTATNEDGTVEQIMSDTRPLMLDEDASDTLTINDGEYISIIEPSAIQLIANN